MPRSRAHRAAAGTCMEVWGPHITEANPLRWAMFGGVSLTFIYSALPSTFLPRLTLSFRSSLRALQTCWLLSLAALSTCSYVPVTTYSQLYQGAAVISSPLHPCSYLLRLDVSSDPVRPSVCQGADFCCQPEPSDRSWYLVDGDSTGGDHDAWFSQILAAAQFPGHTCQLLGPTRRLQAPFEAYLAVAVAHGTAVGQCGMSLCVGGGGRRRQAAGGGGSGKRAWHALSRCL